MNEFVFDGQQAQERVLYTIRAAPLAKRLTFTKVLVLSIFFGLVLYSIATIVPLLTNFLRLLAIFIPLMVMGIGVWWTAKIFDTDRTYLTDRRIIRFDVVTPFVTAKRALFWSEALKAKGFAPNLFYKFMKIGTLVVEPQTAQNENVRVSDVYYYEDLANYIDKILFTVKNQPEEMASFKPFVPKPKGSRDQAKI